MFLLKHSFSIPKMRLRAYISPLEITVRRGRKFYGEETKGVQLLICTDAPTIYWPIATAIL